MTASEIAASLSPPILTLFWRDARPSMWRIRLTKTTSDPLHDIAEKIKEEKEY